MKYRCKGLGFEVVLPEGWRSPGILHRLLRLPLRLMFAGPELAGGPEFYGPANDTIKFAIGPIAPEPSVAKHQADVAAMAARHGHRVVTVDTVDVAGRTHATMVVDVPLPSGKVIRVKNYFLIFHGTEYVITSNLRAGEAFYDQIVRTFKPI
ncbi:MAG: hypothetical protein ABSB30_10535 [Terracidiphilus sp.]